MNRKISSALLLTSIFAVSLSACSASICQRKDRWFARHCSGTDVTYAPDASCEETLKHCDDAHKQAADLYVMCLESQNQCTLQGVSSCAQQFPAGVNLMCTGS
jgi:hypothetical protein